MEPSPTGDRDCRWLFGQECPDQDTEQSGWEFNSGRRRSSVAVKLLGRILINSGDYEIKANICVGSKLLLVLDKVICFHNEAQLITK